MDIRIINRPIKMSVVSQMAEKQFGDMIKAVVDAQQNIMALGGDLHADDEQLLLEKGSNQKSLWGINLYPAKYATDDFIQFDSMINIRPSQNNRSRNVEDPSTQNHIRQIVSKLIIND